MLSSVTAPVSRPQLAPPYGTAALAVWALISCLAKAPKAFLVSGSSLGHGRANHGLCERRQVAACSLPAMRSPACDRAPSPECAWRLRHAPPFGFQMRASGRTSHMQSDPGGSVVSLGPQASLPDPFSPSHLRACRAGSTSCRGRMERTAEPHSATSTTKRCAWWRFTWGEMHVRTTTPGGRYPKERVPPTHGPICMLATECACASPNPMFPPIHGAGGGGCPGGVAVWSGAARAAAAHPVQLGPGAQGPAAGSGGGWWMGAAAGGDGGVYDGAGAGGAGAGVIMRHWGGAGAGVGVGVPPIVGREAGGQGSGGEKAGGREARGEQ